MFAKLDAGAGAWSNARIPRQLQPFQRRHDRAPLRVKGGRELIGQCGPPKSNNVMQDISRRSSARISAATSSNAFDESWKRETACPIASDS